jgi:acyl-CoA synthetase (NDP forming)
MLTDELNRQGLELSVLSQQTRQELRGVLPPESSVSNPVDCLPSRTGEQIRRILEILGREERENIDVLVIVTGDSGLSDNTLIYQEILNARQDSPIPVIPVLSSILTSRAKIERFAAVGGGFFVDEVPLGSALGKVARWSKPAPAGDEPAGYDRQGIETVLRGMEGVLTQGVVHRVLKAAGFNPPRQAELRRGELLAAACREIGFPLVMKVMGPLHKSDVGGVKVGIRGEDEAEAAWNELLSIEGAAGVLVQEMVEGVEVILGAIREGDFGHLVAFGLGGIFTEVLRDVRFGLAPLSRAESMGMIRSIRGYPLLEGVRGMQGLSVDRLADQLIRLSRLVTDFPRIRELDLNPVKGFGSNLLVVDARMSLDA